MYPILAIDIIDAPVQRIRRQHQQKVARVPNALQQIVIKLARLQPLKH